ncbi:major facilitator superfamily [Stemphylium lycopersici]|uniref:ceramidase n=1 Tax=Stemphylium lycopersici TaxID=183478 RepID=A0A364NFQ4_STELY|nr:major facilitator superfamily [Stemphylium lycopersici]RAR16154.1 major facilitator superfamily [Stemphylium lycopersici]
MAPNKPPTHTINLSLPPHARYAALATAYAPTLHVLPDLYSEAVSHLALPSSFFHLLGRLLLRRLHSTEQTSELRGISEASGVPMYLLIAYNVFLDLLVGCTSGGAMTHEPRSAAEATMLHFRTLDWSMPALRDLIVQYEFVERQSGEVVARTLGYVGFVGVLTGVRKGLSISLNFRPYRNARGLEGENLMYCWNMVLVLLGWRPSVASVMRGFLLPREAAGEKKQRRRLVKKSEREQGDGEGEEKEGKKSPRFSILLPYTPTDVVNLLPHMRTSVAYLIFCTGTETIILEKDFQSARTLRSSSFISTTNHDVAFESAANPQAAQQHIQSQTNPFLGASM